MLVYYIQKSRERNKKNRMGDDMKKETKELIIMFFLGGAFALFFLNLMLGGGI